MSDNNPPQDRWWTYLKSNGYIAPDDVTLAASIASYLRWISGGMTDPYDARLLCVEADRIEQDMAE